MWTLGLLAVTALAWAQGLPAALFVVLTGPATIVFAIYALVHARGVEAATSIRMWLWIAMGVGAMSFFGGLGLFLARAPIEHNQACMERAITQTAKRECTAQYEKEYQELLDRIENYGKVTNP